MHRLHSLLSGITAVSLLLGAIPLPVYGDTAETEKSIDILFTHDTHSHLDSFYTYYEGQDQEIGGFAKIKTRIQEQLADDPDTLILDAGDFSMGTLIQAVYQEQAAELRMLGALGSEVTTLGNHEFDYRSEGLAEMLTSAAQSGDPLPELVVCNVDWDAMRAEGLNDAQQQIADAFALYDVKDYTVLTKDEVSVAVLGIFGKDSLECSPTCELLFEDPVTAAKETVKEIQEKEDVDLIVCVSHSGTWEEASKSEDEILAKQVPELDLIISAHTHRELYDPIVHGDTWIVSAGEYGKRLGSLTMDQTENGRWEITDYELIKITPDIEADAGTQQQIEELYDSVDTGYLADFGYTRKTVLAENDVTFSRLWDMEHTHIEQNLGNILSDSFVYAVENMENYDGPSVDVAVVPAGCVRDTFTSGEITVEDVFNAYSLGIGADGISGYPLIGVYLTGRELELVAEIDASISDLMNYARLYLSGMNMTYNPHRLLLNRVSELSLIRDGETISLEKDQLYYVVADLYSGQMLSAVTDLSYGLLSLVPKYADGTPVEDFEDVIILENGRELKAWDAIARYMQSFEDTDENGIPNIPAAYAEVQGRKVVDTSWNPVSLLKNPNKFGVITCAAVILLIVILVLLVRGILKLMKRHRTKKPDGLYH